MKRKEIIKNKKKGKERKEERKNIPNDGTNDEAHALGHAHLGHGHCPVRQCRGL